MTDRWAPATDRSVPLTDKSVFANVLIEVLLLVVKMQTTLFNWRCLECLRQCYYVCKLSSAFLLSKYIYTFGSQPPSQADSESGLKNVELEHVIVGVSFLSIFVLDIVL